MNSDSGWVKGKWGQRGHAQNPSNVTRLSRAISAEDDEHHPQIGRYIHQGAIRSGLRSIVYYQAGIGSGIGLYDHLVGGGTGLGLEENSTYSDGQKADSDHLIATCICVERFNIRHRDVRYGDSRHFDLYPLCLKHMLTLLPIAFSSRGLRISCQQL